MGSILWMYGPNMGSLSETRSFNEPRLYRRARSEQCRGSLLELAHLGHPVGMQRRVEYTLKLGRGLLAAVHRQVGLREKEMARRGALIVCQRPLQMLD